MKQLMRLGLLALCLLLPGQVQAQAVVDSQDPRQMALDIYVGITRGTEPATIALKLRQVIELFRYRCTRVTDYQVFAQRPNITDVKVKCSGDPLYGVTVASNGFVSVFGGNQIVASLDRRDGLIYAFGADGDLSGTSALDVAQVTQETKARVMLGGEYDYIYLSVMLVVLLVMVAAMALVVLRLWRHRKRRRKGQPKGRMKPMKKFTAGSTTSAIKDQLLAESQEVIKFVHKHADTGIFIAVGKRGKRRLFRKLIWAKLYARYSMHFFEVRDAALMKLQPSNSVDVEEVAEGEEYKAPPAG